ncbi:MAG: dTMP kinase [Proteobacteria bacterium]|nr:dTMP kinase [Pseudomonadota bacterium]MBU1419810.1 dTMP kinase [Pseudomonadota bacterium]MBU1456778.1 dTMP kinase [Pseudomonadota bacterium]
MSEKRTGLLIVFEGTDGTGKSTQLQLLAQALRDKGWPVLITYEPTDGVYGKQIRELYAHRDTVSREEELNLFLADRREHVEQLLTPALKSGKIVLCDRYYLSTVAYQGAAGLDPEIILARNGFAPVPDLALLFHAPIHTGVKRITQGRGEELNDFEKEDYLQQVATMFAQINLPFIRRIDAARSIEAIHCDVLNLVQPLLEKLQ